LYYQTIEQQSSVAVEKQTLQAARQLLAISQALLRAGRYAPVEVSRAQLRYSLEERRIKNAQTALDQQLNKDRIILQLPAQSRLVLTSKLEYEPFSFGLKELVDLALAHRQDYLSAQRSLEISELNLKDLKESSRPFLSVVGSYSNSRNISNTTFDTMNYGWTFGGLATWLLFDSGITRVKVRQASADLENSRITIENIRQQVRVDVENAYLNIKNLEQQLKDFEPNRVQAENNLKAVQYRYRNGLDRLIDVFDAEDEMRSLELEYLGLLVSYYSARDQMALVIDSRLPGTRP